MTRSGARLQETVVSPQLATAFEQPRGDVRPSAVVFPTGDGPSAPRPCRRPTIGRRYAPGRPGRGDVPGQRWEITEEASCPWTIRSRRNDTVRYRGPAAAYAAACGASPIAGPSVASSTSSSACPVVVVLALLAYVISGLVGQAQDAASAARLVRDSRQVAELVDLVDTEHTQALLLSVRYESATSGARPSLTAYRRAQRAVDEPVGQGAGRLRLAAARRRGPGPHADQRLQQPALHHRAELSAGRQHRPGVHLGGRRPDRRSRPGPERQPVHHHDRQPAGLAAARGVGPQHLRDQRVLGPDR